MERRTRAILLGATLGLTSLFGCSSGRDDASEPADEEAELRTSARALVGAYRSSESTYAGRLSLEADGSFSATFNRAIVGSSIRCARAPCLAPGSGTWNVSADGKLVLRVTEIAGAEGSRSLKFDYEKSGTSLKLELRPDSLGQQSFLRASDGSEGEEEEQSTAGGACENKQCGEACTSTCVGRANCGMRQGPMFCTDDGRCVSNWTPFLCAR